MYHQRNTEIAAPTVTAPNQDAPTVMAIAPTPKRLSVKKAHNVWGTSMKKLLERQHSHFVPSLQKAPWVCANLALRQNPNKRTYLGIQTRHRLRKTRVTSIWTSQPLRRPRMDPRSTRVIGGSWWMKELNLNFLISSIPRMEWLKKCANNSIAGRKAVEERKSSDSTMQGRINCSNKDRRVLIRN
jgi:hypothetical protein